MIKIEISDIESLVGHLQKSSRGHYVGDCPFCGKEKHFYIKDKTTEVDKNGRNKSYHWDCKRCGENGTIYRLLKHYNVLQDYYSKSIDTSKLYHLQLLQEVAKESIEEGNEEIFDSPNKQLPIGFKRLYSNDYLLRRHFKLKDFYKYKIGITDFSKFKDYIIFAIEEDQQVKGYVTRCLLSKEEIEEKGLKRYKNSTGTNFAKLLFGIDEITENTSTIILVEGIFDKIRLDNLLCTDDSEDIKVICTFGNKISNMQILKLCRSKYKIEKVILFYDVDASKQTKKYSKELSNYFEEVRIACLMDGKDPSDSDDESIFYALTNLFDYTSFYYEKLNIHKLK